MTHQPAGKAINPPTNGADGPGLRAHGASARYTEIENCSTLHTDLGL